MQNHESASEWTTQALALRRLAASLVADPHQAEDLVQDTLVRALERGPSGLASPGIWLRTVARNLLRDRARSGARRSATERGVARPEALPSDAQVLERLEVLERVTQELARLPESYRTTLHARFFEGLGPSEIAARSGVSIETVRSRLHRGLALLRERLDRAYGGDRSAWVAALAPLGGSRAPLDAAAEPALPVGGVAVGVKLAWLALGAVAVLAVAVGWFAWRASPLGDPSSAVAAAEPIEPATPRAGEATAAAAATDVDGGLGHERQLRDAAIPTEDSQSSEGVAARDARASLAPIELSGTVVIDDVAASRELRAESGTFRLYFGEREGELEARSIVFRDGTWSTSVPAGSLVKLDDLVVGRRWAVLPVPAAKPATTEPIELRGRLPAPVVLHVRDRDTQLDLRGVEVRRQTLGGGELVHPGAGSTSRRLIRDGVSPVELDSLDQMAARWIAQGWPVRYFVHVPGYAWQLVGLDHDSRDVRTVELERGAELVVDAAAQDVPEGTLLRVSNADGEPWQRHVRAEAKWNGERLALADFAPGVYSVEALSKGDAGSVALASAVVELAVGSSVHVRLQWSPGDAVVGRGRMRGTLRVPAGLDAAHTTLRLHYSGGELREQADVELLVASMAVDEHDPSVRHWAAEGASGTYAAVIDAVCYSQPFEYDRARGEAIALEVGPLASAEVVVLAARGGAQLEPQQVKLSPRWATSARGVRLQRDSATGAFVGHVVSGDYWLFAVAEGFRGESDAVTLTAGRNRLSSRLHEAMGITLRALDRSTNAPVELLPGRDFDLELGGERCRDWQHKWNGGANSAIFVIDAGRYTLRFRELADWQPPAPIEVDVVEGEFTEVRVELERRP